MHHPSCRSGLFLVGLHRKDYNPSLLSHGGKELFIKDPNSSLTYNTGIITPKPTGLNKEIGLSSKATVLVRKGELKQINPLTEFAYNKFKPVKS
jgi:hypothetical protein